MILAHFQHQSEQLKRDSAYHSVVVKLVFTEYTKRNVTSSSVCRRKIVRLLLVVMTFRGGTVQGRHFRS